MHTIKYSYHLTAVVATVLSSVQQAPGLTQAAVGFLAKAFFSAKVTLSNLEQQRE